MKLIMVRHGKDDERYRGGWSMLDLTEEGMEQAKRLAKYLKTHESEYNITQIISSDLPRTMSTAEFISAELGVEIQKEPAARETNNGELAGMLNETALERYPGLFFGSLQMDEAYPNGESPRAFYTRIRAWFEDFCAARQDENGNVLLVTHGGVIQVIYHLVKGVEWTNQSRVFRADTCSVHVLDMNTMVFETENRTDFLE